MCNWPVWLNEEGQYRLIFSTHYLSSLPFHPFLPHCCLYLSAKAIPGPARSENSAACQTSHSDTLSLPFLHLCQPSTPSSHRLSWKVAHFCCARSCIITLLSLSIIPNKGSRGPWMDYFTIWRRNEEVKHMFDCAEQSSTVLSSDQGDLTAGTCLRTDLICCILLFSHEYQIHQLKSIITCISMHKHAWKFDQKGTFKAKRRVETSESYLLAPDLQVNKYW